MTIDPHKMAAWGLTEKLGPDIPSPDDLRWIREALGLSQSELAGVLGFSPLNGHKVIRDWEEGTRAGQPFKPTPTAWTAFRFAAILALQWRDTHPDNRLYGIARMIPEVLK